MIGVPARDGAVATPANDAIRNPVTHQSPITTAIRCYARPAENRPIATFIGTLRKI